jgi:hypothetical protein
LTISKIFSSIEDMGKQNFKNRYLRTLDPEMLLLGFISKIFFKILKMFDKK